MHATGIQKALKRAMQMATYSVHQMAVRMASNLVQQMAVKMAAYSKMALHLA